MPLAFSCVLVPLQTAVPLLTVKVGSNTFTVTTVLLWQVVELVVPVTV
jgi:hypothetical protein